METYRQSTQGVNISQLSPIILDSKSIGQEIILSNLQLQNLESQLNDTIEKVQIMQQTTVNSIENYTQVEQQLNEQKLYNQQNLPIIVKNSIVQCGFSNSKIIPLNFKRIYEEKECKYCQEIENGDIFINPCLCKGSLQYAHHKCLKQLIECNYLDEEKTKFIKPLLCDICKFEFNIKIYKSCNIKESFQNIQKKKRIICQLIIILSLIIMLTLLLIISIIYREYYKSKFELIVFSAFGGLLLLGFIMVFILNLYENISYFYWYIQDRNKIESDDSLSVTQQTLNRIMKITNFRYQPKN